MKTNKERCAYLNKILASAGITAFFFGLAPRGYWPYRIYEAENGSTIFGGYFKDARAAALRMKFAVQEKRPITPYDIFGDYPKEENAPEF